MGPSILVYLEHDGRKFHGETENFISKAGELAKSLGGQTIGVLIGDNNADLLMAAQELKCHQIVVVKDPTLKEYQPDLYKEALYQVLQATTPYVVLFRHSYAAAELGPGLAFRCRAPMISNCLDIEATDGRVRVTRPYLAEKVYGRVAPLGSPPYFFTLQRALPRGDGLASDGPADIREVAFSLPPRVRMRSLGVTQRLEGIDISQAELIVAVGRGIRERANLKLAEELAHALGATLACSRPIADLGWLPVERQVGVSGKTVHPKVYIACGISGESQHLAGMRDSRLIIAINSDPKAPIFRVAHYGIVQDLRTFLPVLTVAARGEKN